MKEGWEYKKLGDLGTFVRGGNFSKKDFVENGFPCIHYGQIHMKFGIETFKHISSVPAGMVKPDRCAHKGDLVIAITSEDDAGSCKCTAWMGDYDVYVGGHTAIYRHTMQPKYVSYYFLSPFFQKDKLEYTHGFKVVEISPKDIAKITIPVPPLSEQQSIVDYLDSAFAKIDAMKANAEKALNEAKALFQASLKEMLEPKEGWEEKKLGEICTFSQGVQVPLQNQALKESAGYTRFLRIIDFTQGSEPPRYVPINDAKYWMNHEDIAIVRYGASTGFICTGLEGTLANNLFRLNIKCDVSPHYLIYVLKSEIFQSVIKVQMNGAAMPAISFGLIEGIKMPVPSHSEQQSIVVTLDSLKSKVDRLQANYDKISQECNSLKQAILRQVFE